MESVSRRRLLQGLGVAGLAGLAGCGAAGAERPSLVNAPAPTNAPSTVRRQLVSSGPAAPVEAEAAPLEAEVAPLEAEVANPFRAITATAVVSQIEVFASPDERAEVTHRMDNPTTTNGPLVFLTTFNAADWNEVLLPVRPNGSTGWVRNSDVVLASHNYRIQVDLPDFRMRVFEDDQTVFDAVAGVASNNTPTPGGIYYITELIDPIVPNSVYGAHAYGLSGFSEVFETFNGGPGQLGIHGTNDPDTLGTAVSAGCIRLHNDDIRRIRAFLPLGVPVTVTA